MSKICLIRPPAVETIRFASTSITPPIGLAYIAGAITASGRDVEVVDAVALAPDNYRRYFKGYTVGLDLSLVVQKVSIDVTTIGVSAVFTHEWPLIVQLIKLLRERFPTTPIIVGGEHVTAMPAFCCRTSEADFFVSGEGEETIIELLAAIEKKEHVELESLSKIPGITFRTPQNTVVVNRRRERRRQIDSIPLPQWELFALPIYHLHRFVGGMYSSSLTVPILATRGCPYRCTYCSSPNMWTALWVPRDPVLVVDEIESYMQRFGAANFPFQDLTAIIKKDWIKKFCEEILSRKLKISWQLPTGTRSEAIDQEVADLLARSGMKSMAYAPESGSEETRRLVQKKVNAKSLMDSIKAAEKSGLNVSAFFVIGFPHDRHKNLKEGISFVRNVAREGVADISVGYYMALPGTELFQSLYADGKISIDKDYFSHILDAQSFFPRKSFTPHISRLSLCIWKFYMIAVFYYQRLQVKLEAGFFKGWGDILSGVINSFGSVDHGTKLQSVIRNFVLHIINSWGVLWRPRWISFKQEEELLMNWDEIYRSCLSTPNSTKEAGTISLDYYRQLQKDAKQDLVLDHQSKKSA